MIFICYILREYVTHLKISLININQSRSEVVKILLVKADHPVLALLCKVITSKYYTVELTTDGQNGLSLVTSCVER